MIPLPSIQLYPHMYIMHYRCLLKSLHPLNQLRSRRYQLNTKSWSPVSTAC